ncbi:4027_t:CDS:2 [Paraglomus occultum]|uniref:4027_t:CDS:1 n=1 Tax=Paraglomus occultum TaxID=144539 RepID=A0A9N9CNU5_9GLOM|nr:4027_t:CDS:2 [Paraglomus occultum]
MNSNILDAGAMSVDIGIAGVQDAHSSLPKYIEVALEVGKIINHAAIAVLTGNIAFIVEDIVSYAVAAKHCKSECRRLAEQIKMSSESAKDLLEQLEKDAKEIENKSFISALKSFAIVLEDARSVIKQHAEGRYGLKIFHAKKFALEFLSMEERLDQACQRLNFAINIRHYVDSQEIVDRQNSWREEDRKAFEEINNSVKEALDELKRNDTSKSAVSETLLDDVRIPFSQFTDVRKFKTDRMRLAVYNTADEERNLKNVEVIIKVTLARESNIDHKRRLAQEVFYLQRLAPSANIINLIGITSMRGGYMGLVLEYCSNGDLKTFIANQKLHADWGLKRAIALGIVQGIAYLHEAGIVHKTICSENILLDKCCEPKITNFRKARLDEATTQLQINTFEEQMRWDAPERLQDDAAKFTKACDVFSFGIVLYEIVAEKYPWAGYSLDDVYTARREGKTLELPPSTPSVVSVIYTMCTETIPTRRFKTKQIIEHLENIRPEELDSTPSAVPDSSSDALSVLNRLPTLSISTINADEEEEIVAPNVREILTRANACHTSQQYKEAFDLFMSISNESREAMFRIGSYYFFGKHVTSDRVKAREYLERAAEGEDGNGDAIDMLGYMYLTGEGMPTKDRVKAVECFKKAVEMEIPHGMYHLGVCYMKGVGKLKKNEPRAKELIMRAVKLGVEEAVKFAHSQHWDS